MNSVLHTDHPIRADASSRFAAPSTLIEVDPEGQFVMYGLGVSLKDMASPAKARACVPLS